MTKIAGSFQTAARLMPSWKDPMETAPSPKYDNATLPVPRNCSAKAAPEAMGIPPPTMALVPTFPDSGS